jgi:hypothetical protein
VVVKVVPTGAQQDPAPTKRFSFPLAKVASPSPRDRKTKRQRLSETQRRYRRKISNVVGEDVPTGAHYDPADCSTRVTPVGVGTISSERASCAVLIGSEVTVSTGKKRRRP